MTPRQKSLLMILNRTSLLRKFYGRLNKGVFVNLCGASFPVLPVVTSQRNSHLYQSADTTGLSVNSLVTYATIRYKSSSTKQRKGTTDDYSDDEEEEDEEELNSVDFSEEDVEPPNGPPGFKYMKVHSLRCDNIISKALKYSNSLFLVIKTGDNLKQIEIKAECALRSTHELFYASKLLHCDVVLLKKSKKAEEGDTLDVLIEDLKSTRNVKRVEIVKVSSNLTRSGKPIVFLRVWRAPFEVNKF